MISSHALLADLRRLLKILEDDLRERIAATTPLTASLQSEWQAARNAKRTGETYETWLEEVITQAAVHWVLACVFVRFIEDNDLIERPYLSGPGERIALARDRHEAYFRAHPHDSDREYLIACFREVEELPGMRALFDEQHSPVFRIGVSGDAAMALMAFWQKVDPDTGRLVHAFTDEAWNTQFLGNLYQDLSEPARKRYALLQTPAFVGEFILDRTLTPALSEFGYRVVRLIDPACGSGHFLLWAFEKLFDVWAANEPARNSRDTVQKALDGVYGVDLNPFAVAIARFRLLAAALRACNIRQLRDAPAFKIHLAVGDSLLHGRRFRELALSGEEQAAERHGYAHVYAIEDLDEVNHILGQQYHVVVANPPYITVKDAVLNQAYRARYSACHMKYSLGVPFTQRIFELALSGHDGHPAGYVGMISTNSFMKREFGKKLIEEYLPKVDLTHVIDTSGAYIPGHGTPTVILFGRDRRPVGDTVRTVMGIKGEPATPDDPAQGLVWRAIVTQVDREGSESAFVSVADTVRATFLNHPWSIGGGGASDLLLKLHENARHELDAVVAGVGVQAFTLEDDAFVGPVGTFRRLRVPASFIRSFVTGVAVRDWTCVARDECLFPYGEDLAPALAIETLWQLWPYRSILKTRMMFRKTQVQRGLEWYEFGMFIKDRFTSSRQIVYSFVGTHNHFALASPGVFNRHAPIVRLKFPVPDEISYGLIGLLNSSLACFWMKQTFHNKGSTVDDKGARQRTDAFEDFYEYTGTGLGIFPLVSEYPFELARQLDRLAQEVAALSPANVIAASAFLTLGEALKMASEELTSIRHRMIALQEELDWRCYELYGLLYEVAAHPNPPKIELGQRAFEIVMARQQAAGELETSWFERHRSTPTPSLPAHWPEDYKRVVERRIALIESDRDIRLIERPEYKRRWNTPAWLELEQAALRAWLLDRLEDTRYWSGDPQLRSVNRLADVARADVEFMQAAELHVGRRDFDVATIVGELIGSESIPFLPVLRYGESGLRKREQWENSWELQRKEDEIDAEVKASIPSRKKQLEDICKQSNSSAELDDIARKWVASKLKEDVEVEEQPRKQAEVGDIAVPPKYQSKDFLKSDYWRLRGGLDVPKERWVSYPGCERGADGSLVIAWAGWDHLQQATALAAYYLDMKDNEGWEPARLQPLLAGLLELVPWLKQWHNDYDAAHSTRMGDYFESFVVDEARALGWTLEDLRAWRPGAAPARRGRKRAG